MVVTLDPNEKYCGCGGHGPSRRHHGASRHAASISRSGAGRSVRRRRAPAAIPAVPSSPFLWHRALAAATASAIHIGGPGKFYISGPNARFVNIDLLNRYMQEMVKMSPLQGYVFEVVPRSDELAVIGAAINAQRASQNL